MTPDQDINRVMEDRYCLYNIKKKPITWSAVASGALIAFGLTFLFHLLTLGIGLAIVSDNDQGIRSLALNGFIWTLVGGIIILFIAGWKTGKLIKIYPDDTYKCHTTVSGYSDSITTETSTETTTLKSKSCCYHGMTHGFIAWVLFLMISLFFTIFISYTTSMTALNSSFLNIPLGIPQAIAESGQDGQNRNAILNNQQNASPRMNGRTQNSASGLPVSPKTAERAGVEVIGLFLIFALGAASCSIGSYLGLLSHRKCMAKKCNKNVNV